MVRLGVFRRLFSLTISGRAPRRQADLTILWNQLGEIRSCKVSKRPRLFM